MNTLGYFLKKEYILKAIELLNSQMDSNLNIYKTFNCKSFKKIRITDKIINTEILNNLFYGLDDYFLINYQIGKGMNGLRNYSFISHKLLIIYYSIGLYIKDLVQTTYEEKNQGYFKKNIKSYYGTHINNNFLSEKKIAEIHYLYNYIDYLKEFEKQIKYEENKSKILIELDVKDYYDNINIDILLEIIEKCSLPSKIRQLKFDQNTKNIIKCFLTYLQPLGIIQSDNNIISAFLGDLYLTELDLLIYDHLNGFDGISISLIRYVDDIKIIIKGNELNINKFCTIDAIWYFEKFLYDKLKLKLNIHKVKISTVNNQDNVFQILNTLSVYDLNEGIDYIFETELSDSELLNLRINNILISLKTICETSENNYNSLESELKTIKLIFRDNRIINKLKSQEYYTNLETLMLNCNFKFVLLSFKEFHSLIVLCKDVFKKYLEYLLGKKKFNYLEIKAIEHILFQDFEIKDKEIKQLKIKLFKKASDQGLSPFYYFTNKYTLDSKKFQTSHLYNFKNKFSKLSDKYIDQIKFRIISEKNLNYDNALNHLLNQIHQLVYDKFKDKMGSGKFDADDCIKKLQGIKGLKIEYIIGLKNLFNRRNNNPISHSGLDGEIAWSVSKNEYSSYREIVFKIEEVLLFLL